MVRGIVSIRAGHLRKSQISALWMMEHYPACSRVCDCLHPIAHGPTEGPLRGDKWDGLVAPCRSQEILIVGTDNSI
jgi:hypothetical protein